MYVCIHVCGHWISVWEHQVWPLFPELPLGAVECVLRANSKENYILTSICIIVEH